MILSAPAKINLHLHVLGKRSDGYHMLDTSFIFSDAADTLYVEDSDKLCVTCSDASLQGKDNLVWKVLDALRQRYAISQGLSVHIKKYLPMQAGLGGGSSDAATALMAACRLWKIDISLADLITFSAPMGADIPCFLFGQASLASGLGDVLKPLDNEYYSAINKGLLLLAHPGCGIPTAAAFGLLAAPALTMSQAADTMRAPFQGVGANDLERVACNLSHEMEIMLVCMRKHSKLAWMSGSGSACVAWCEHRQQADLLAAKLRENGLAQWLHIGSWSYCHPLANEWGVAKR
ncbi:MAG: 4-(cytidine 5'-diphospho)-2-C-methyl-D-erythritol kinase [Mariprofundales bacterium]